MGIAYFVSSFAYLSGPPIQGALLNNGGGVHWYKPVIFSGVCVMFLCDIEIFDRPKSSVLAAIPFILISRHLQAKRKGTQFV
jgi:hypothetical protein